LGPGSSLTDPAATRAFRKRVRNFKTPLVSALDWPQDVARGIGERLWVGLVGRVNKHQYPYANHGAGIFTYTKLGDFVRANVAVQ